MRNPKTKAVKAQDLLVSVPDSKDSEYGDEMSKEEILDSIERGLLEALAGQSRPALEFLDELDNE